RNRRGGTGARDLGLATETGFRWSTVGVSAIVALIAVGTAYLLLALSDWLFQTDFRIYTMALAMIDARHWSLFLAYVLPFVAFFLVRTAGRASQLRGAGANPSGRRQMLVFSVVLAGPLLLFFVIAYLPIFSGGTMLVNDPLKAQFVLIGYQFLVLLPVAACLAVSFSRVSGTVYTGAITAAMIVAWNLTTTTTVPDDQGRES